MTTNIRKPGIPSIISLPTEFATVLGPIKETLEIITGQRSGPVAQLAATATTSDIINKINELIARLNQAGR